MTYIEKEIKVLNVNAEELSKKLKVLGATEVFNDYRTITHFDYADRRLTKSGNVVKLTEEGKFKLNWDGKTETGEKEAIKVFVSRKQETVDFLNRLGLLPVAESKSHRISFEWEGIDFDIDEFPQIPAFLEVDLGDSGKSLQEVLVSLGLETNEQVQVNTPEIYRKYGLDYFDTFQINNHT